MLGHSESPNKFQITEITQIMLSNNNETQLKLTQKKTRNIPKV